MTHRKGLYVSNCECPDCECQRRAILLGSDASRALPPKDSLSPLVESKPVSHTDIGRNFRHSFITPKGVTRIMPFVTPCVGCGFSSENAIHAVSSNEQLRDARLAYNSALSVLSVDPFINQTPCWKAYTQRDLDCGLYGFSSRFGHSL